VFDTGAVLSCKCTWAGYIYSSKKHTINIKVDITVPCLLLAIKELIRTYLPTAQERYINKYYI
jgi:hypothetical protein